MDHFFQEGIWPFDYDSFLFETNPVIQSSFLPYTSTPRIEIGAERWSSTNGSNPNNMNKRLLEFARKSWKAKSGRQEPENSRCHRHMINERMRREREKKGFLALHSLLPLGTKNDKNSIVQMAVSKIEETKRCKEMLERRNNELKGKLASIGGESARTAKIRFKVTNPASGVDSMVEVLKCLNSLGSKILSVKSNFGNQEIVAIVDVESEMEAAEVEKAVQRTLQDVERKLRCRFPQRQSTERDGWISPTY